MRAPLARVDVEEVGRVPRPRQVRGGGALLDLFNFREETRPPLVSSSSSRRPVPLDPGEREDDARRPLDLVVPKGRRARPPTLAGQMRRSPCRATTARFALLCARKTSAQSMVKHGDPGKVRRASENRNPAVGGQRARWLHRPAFGPCPRARCMPLSYDDPRQLFRGHPPRG